MAFPACKLNRRIILPISADNWILPDKAESINFPQTNRDLAVFEAAKSFLEEEFGVPVHITGAAESNLPKAVTALPFKPAIVIE